MSQVNNLSGIDKYRPNQWTGIEYLSQIELWIKQVTENVRGIRDTQSFTVATLPPATDFDPIVSGRASFVYVSDESGGAQMAFSDGANWRRFSDRAIVS